MNRFISTKIEGVVIVEPEIFHDDRGWFSRGFHAEDFERLGFTVLQQNSSFNFDKGTVRGLHFQYPPASEAKVLRCVRGRIFDVVVDLRPESKTYLEWFGVELSGLQMIHIPARCAHGYQTLEDATEVTYLLSALYAPDLEGGIPHDDELLNIAWPLPVTRLSEKDRKWAPLKVGKPALMETA